MKVGFAGPFSVRLADRVRRHLNVECEMILAEESGVVGLLPEVDVLVTLGFTREMGAAAARLKLVQVPGAGLDRIDRSALPAGTALANAYNHEVGIAEYVMGAMLALSRDLCRLDAALRRGRWESPWVPGAEPPPTWPELAGKTLGILGYGRIGQELARRARAFDMTIWAMRQRVTREDAPGLAFLGGPEALDEILKRADYLAITLPLTEATRGLRRRGLSGAPPGDHRGGRARRVVSISNERRAGVSLPPPVPRAAKRARDTACVGMDGRHHGGPRSACRGEYRPRGARGAGGQYRSVGRATG
ncbi:MAG: hypothetical protein DME10_04985 [Candidatus Rokuibacteriota bacterium]|nr:MAG: hypothetical protein DME10_04985 [Candidatus Rokubacteria bacterium]